SDGVSHDIEITKPSNVIEGLKVTLSASGREVLLEVSESNIDVVVEGRRVIDVIQISLGDVFYVDEEAYIIMSLLDVACPSKNQLSVSRLMSELTCQGIWTSLEKEFLD